MSGHGWEGPNIPRYESVDDKPVAWYRAPDDIKLNRHVRGLMRDCYYNYLKYHWCLNEKKAYPEPCEWYKRAYLNSCPTNWPKKWDEQRAEGTFPSRV